MNPIESKDSTIGYAKRFRWISNDKFKIVNAEGIEKIVEVKDDGFKEISFASVPLFSKDDEDQNS